MGKLNLAKSATTATKDIIRDIIKSLALVSSHYCRSTMKSHYLPSGLSENRLYLDYKDYCTELGVVVGKVSFYKHIFTSEFNIGFHRPKKCEYCSEFENKNDGEKLKMQDDINAHLVRKSEDSKSNKQE